MTRSDSSRRLLIIDDDEVDRLCTVKALRRALPDIDIIEAEDGVEGLKRIRVDAPDLVILDLRMPGVSGFDVLAQAKNGGPSKRIPILMFSTSDLDTDVARCLDLHANAYLRKPDSMAAYNQLAESICRFWFQSAVPVPGNGG